MKGHKAIYQEFVEFPKDSNGNFYQSRCIYAYEACGLGFRRGGKILNNMSKFVGHIKNNKGIRWLQKLQYTKHY